METIIYLIRHSEQLKVKEQENCKETSEISQIKNEQNPLSNNGEILAKYEGKRIVVVSHGAAIKFLLQHYCKYDYESNSFIFNDKMKIFAKLESPSVLKLVFERNRLKMIKKYERFENL